MKEECRKENEYALNWIERQLDKIEGTTVHKSVIKKILEDAFGKKIGAVV
jgi:hypothetical protein